jgi:seryl-tRNA synthetase
LCRVEKQFTNKSVWRTILPKLNELSYHTNCLIRENMILQKDIQILKKNHDILRRDIYELKSSHIFQHVGEHDDRLDEVDEELDDLKKALEKHSNRIQRYEVSENATEKMQMDDLKATIEHLSKRIEQLECLEDAMEKMKIDETRKDATDEAEWEQATLTE